MNDLKHLAIIMDGNRRWAKRHALSVSIGHRKGADAIDEVAEFCINRGIKFLTLYAFSTENWHREKSEVDFLMKLFDEFLDSKRVKFIDNEIKFETIGDLSAFNQNLQDKIAEVKAQTSKFTKLTMILAVNYGSRDEITRACKKLIAKNAEISETTINSALDSAEFGDVDLLIRTGGEQRLSNFLLWQASYAELHFSDTLWPDFRASELEIIVENYKKIDRKFGR